MNTNYDESVVADDDNELEEDIGHMLIVTFHNERNFPSSYDINPQINRKIPRHQWSSYQFLRQIDPPMGGQFRGIAGTHYPALLQTALPSKQKTYESVDQTRIETRCPPRHSVWLHHRTAIVWNYPVVQ